MSNRFTRRVSRRASRWLLVLSDATGTAGTAAILSAGTAAHADPSFTSAFVGVGSDIQDQFAGFEGSSPQAPTTQTVTAFPLLHSSAATNNEGIASFDAAPAGGSTTNPGCIISKTGGPAFDRPNSTTAGITALLAAINGTGWENSSASCTGATVNVTGEIDFARAARGPKTGGSTLTFIPYARDAVGILADDRGTGHLATLTTAQLTSLYTSSTGTITVNGDTVHACLTISGSTPRSNLESALGITDAQANTAANAAGCNNIAQHSGNAFLTATQSLPSGSDAVIPISAGSWIGQANGLAVDRSDQARAAGFFLAAVDSLGQPYTGTAPNLAPNTTYFQSTSYGYNLWVVVPTTSISGFGANAALESLFVGSSSAICSSTEQTQVVNRFGFDSLVSAEGTCGSITTQGNS
ncbi:MAG: hypothetical protein JO368_01700 [Acidimicrobiales bacterium]|nr:hypothetical protein [Acidimicrobiales bacterium]